MLSSKRALMAWKRRCWVYLATILDGGLHHKLTIERLVVAYQSLTTKPSAQKNFQLILDRLLHFHRYDVEYDCHKTWIETMEHWRPSMYETCMFNPHVLQTFLQCRYIEHVLCSISSTRFEYVRFLLHMLTWKPSPSFPMNSFSVNNFRLLLCELLAQESTNVIEMISSKKSGGGGSGGSGGSGSGGGTSTMMGEDGAGGLSGGGGLSVEGTDGNKYNKEKIYEMNKKKKIENDKRKYFSDIYADMTLMTW